MTRKEEILEYLKEKGRGGRRVYSDNIQFDLGMSREHFRQTINQLLESGEAKLAMGCSGKRYTIKNKKPNR